MADLLQNLRALRDGARDVKQLDPAHAETLSKLGLIETSRGAWGQVKAKLTDAGRQKLQQIDMTSVTPSPVGREVQRQLPDAALLALSNLRLGHPPSELEGKALLARGLVVENHGIYSITRTGADVLSSMSSQERLRSITASHLRG